MPRNRDLIVIVDVQAAFALPPALVAKMEAYSRTFRKRVFTKFVNPPGSLFRTALKREACAPGSPDTRLLIPPRKEDWVFAKAGYGLGHYHLGKLRSLKVAEAEICGMDTDACVLGVMFSLFDSGILPRIKAELCWSSQGLQKETFRIIEAQFGQAGLGRLKTRKGIAP